MVQATWFLTVYICEFFSQAMTQAQEDLMKRQEELEKKAAELQRREQQMRSAQYNSKW